MTISSLIEREWEQKKKGKKILLYQYNNVRKQKYRRKIQVFGCFRKAKVWLQLPFKKKKKKSLTCLHILKI